MHQATALVLHDQDHLELQSWYTSLLRVACEVITEPAWVLSLTVPHIQEENSNGGTVGDLLRHSCRDRPADNDTHWEVSL